MKKQIVFGGKIMEGYFIQYKDGMVNIISTKQTSIRSLSIPKNGSALYPKVVFRYNGKNINADVHRVIAENLIPFPRPKCIPKDEWDNTPEIVKSHVKSLYFVNHKDHDKYNCHPTNLEWVTSKGNSHAYQKHKSKA
jgi:hypothetical protein